MKEKRGFTLVELLAVIALLAIVTVIGSYGVSGVKTAVKEQQWNNKVNLIENRAKVLGEDNKVLLTGQCTINEVTHNNAKVITVKNLIDKKYITTNEKDIDDNKIIINDITGESVNNWKICIYLEDNTVYAELITDETKMEEGNTNPVEPVVPYNNPHIEIDTISSSTNSIDITMIATPGDSQIAKYMVSKDSGRSWTTINNSSTTCTYQFTGLTPDTSYDIEVKAIDVKGYESNVDIKTFKTLKQGGETDECVDDSDTLATNICTNGTNLATCIKNHYNMNGASANIYYHNTSLANGAGDNSYRYSGSNCAVKNYVCFGSTASTCSDDNLYRIIGVFGNQVKLIKNTSIKIDISTDQWSTTVDPNNSGYYSNVWANSTLNKGVLNGTYLNGIESTWKSKIATTNWKVGGFGNTEYYTPKQFYDNELGSSSSATTYSAKIGLMYVNDYAYATSPDNWIKGNNSFNTKLTHSAS